MHRVNYETELNEFHLYRSSRQDIIARLKAFINKQGIELHTLQENQKKLEELLTNIEKKETASIGIFKNMPPFNTQKGKLKWPVNGKLLKRFGNLKKRG